jgi:hypothetical protein
MSVTLLGGAHQRRPFFILLLRLGTGHEGIIL